MDAQPGPDHGFLTRGTRAGRKTPRPAARAATCGWCTRATPGTAGRPDLARGKTRGKTRRKTRQREGAAPVAAAPFSYFR